MDLSSAEVGYFIQQVAFSAASFGVAQADITIVGTALNTLFGHRCSPPTAVLPQETPELQAICIKEDCPIAVNATCAAYAMAVEPATASMSMTMSGNGSAAATATMTGSATHSTSHSMSGSATGMAAATVTTSGAGSVARSIWSGMWLLVGL